MHMLGTHTVSFSRSGSGGIKPDKTHQCDGMHLVKAKVSPHGLDDVTPGIPAEKGRCSAKHWYQIYRQGRCSYLPPRPRPKGAEWVPACLFVEEKVSVGGVWLCCARYEVVLRFTPRQLRRPQNKKRWHRGWPTLMLHFPWQFTPHLLSKTTLVLPGNLSNQTWQETKGVNNFTFLA